MTDTDPPISESTESAPLPGPRGGQEMSSPVDLPAPESEEPHPLLWASTAIAVAAAFLLVFNATALRGWAYQLEPGPVSERIVAVADGWHGQTARFHLDRPVTAMSGWWESLKAMEFGGSETAEAPAPAEETPAEEEPRPGFSVE